MPNNAASARWPLRFAIAATAVAVVVPTQIVHWITIAHVAFAQTVAVFLWGVALATWGFADPRSPVPWQRIAPLGAALLLLMLGVAGSWIVLRTPAGPSLCALGLLAASALALLSSGRLACGPYRAAALSSVLWALAITGAWSTLVAAVQTFRPEWTGGVWFAGTGASGRVGANLHQPNHLGLLLMWSVLACGALAAKSPKAKPLLTAIALAAAVAIALTSSRIALLMVLIAGTWALLDRRLTPSTRRVIVMATLVTLATTVLWQWAGSALGNAASVPQPLGRRSARMGVLHDTLVLIGQNPWFGVGWGEFNLAWTLSPFEPGGRTYFGHTHNLVLNLLVELGIPLGGTIVALLGWTVVRLWQRSRPASTGNNDGLIASAMVSLALLHCMVEFPLWFAYFLLPAIWLCGPALQAPSATPYREELQSTPPRQRPWLLYGAATAFAAFIAWIDFVRVMPAALPATDPTPVAQRIAAASSSRLFRHQADYQLVLNDPAASADLYKSARHVVIDAALLQAWSASLERAGRLEEARYVSRRLLTFTQPALVGWRDLCNRADPIDPIAPCVPRSPDIDWRSFR